MSQGWIGVDLDGTLATHDFEIYPGPHYIGTPVMPMVERVRGWLAQGLDVRIMTARVAPAPEGSDAQTRRKFDIAARVSREVIREFCLMMFGRELPVTCSKDYQMLELWDDRAVRVRINTGQRCCDV